MLLTLRLYARRPNGVMTMRCGSDEGIQFSTSIRFLCVMHRDARKLIYTKIQEVN